MVEIFVQPCQLHYFVLLHCITLDYALGLDFFWPLQNTDGVGTLFVSPDHQCVNGVRMSCDL